MASNIGRINNIEAPVVPMIDARIVPTNRIDTLSAGLGANVPEICIPLDTTYKVSNNNMNGIYSEKIVSIIIELLIDNPKLMQRSIRKIKLQPRVILP